MFLKNYFKQPQKMKSALRVLTIPVGILLILTQGKIALSEPVFTSQVPNVTNFEDLIDLLDEDAPDIIIGGEEENTSNEPEVIVEGEENEEGDVIVGNNDPRFTCGMYNGQYTVMYHPESQPGESYAWAIPSQMGDNWDPQRRCNVISGRLESYRPDGLVELTTGQVNGYDTLCVTTEANPNCRIVLTVPVGQDPIQTRDQVFDALTVADSGQQTQGVYTFTNSGNPLNNSLGSIFNGDLSGLNQTLGGNSSSSFSGSGIYLKPFLDPQDGGTGNYFNSNSSSQPSQNGGRQLNPNIFR